jgi:hypothetical protein
MLDLASKPEGTTLKEVTTYLRRHRIPVQCAEGDYKEKTMWEIAAEQVLSFHMNRNKQVRIHRSANTLMRAAWKMWMNDEFDDEAWSSYSADHAGWTIFYSTPFKFVKGKIIHPDHIES